MVDNVNTGVTIPSDVLDDFDDVLWEQQKQGELPRGNVRSSVIEQLMREYIDEHREYLEDPNTDPQRDESGNRRPATAPAAN